ncbi:hypothetical protein NPIL_376791, partial [Nephila pilipes]
VALLEKRLDMDSHFCDGVLITRLHILTSGNCLSTSYQGHEDRRIENIFAAISPDPNGYGLVSYPIRSYEYPRNTQYQAALLMVPRDPVPLGKNIRLLCLPPSIHFQLPNNSTTIVTWKKDKKGKTLQMNIKT